ncbi:MAG TPA: hypothetical protein VND45_16025 [Thermoanaerobaculia bacterium]|jgi:hypothetical protein|nr:hypothetical protein [Thermoanaerobaculia bacterium]
MHRLRVAAVVLLAVLVAAQLTLHNHSLIPEGGGGPALACSLCAFGADGHALAAPVSIAALVLLGLLIIERQSAFASAIRVARGGRAPPRLRSLSN